MALWIYSYMCKICIYVHIFSMMRLYVCCEHCATMVNWLSFLIWPGQNLCSHPHRFSCPMTVWPSSCDPPCEHQGQLMLSAPREAVPYACWSAEYDQPARQRSYNDDQEYSEEQWCDHQELPRHAFVLDCASRAWLGCQAVSKIYVLNVSTELFSFNVHLTS